MLGLNTRFPVHQEAKIPVLVGLPILKLVIIGSSLEAQTVESVSVKLKMLIHRQTLMSSRYDDVQFVGLPAVC